MSILTMKTVRMVKCMEITGLPREATISTVLRAWQNYRANYNKNHKSHPLTGKLKSAWLKLFLMAVSWGFVTLQQRLIWGKHIELLWPDILYKPRTFSSISLPGLAIPYGFAVLMQAMVFFSLNVGYKYQALWEWLAGSCEKLFPFLKTDEKDSKLLLSSCSCSEDSDSGNED